MGSGHAGIDEDKWLNFDFNFDFFFFYKRLRLSCTCLQRFVI